MGKDIVNILLEEMLQVECENTDPSENDDGGNNVTKSVPRTSNVCSAKEMFRLVGKLGEQ